MTQFRFAIAVILICAIPAAISFWFIIHPFAAFWRRFGRGRTYAAVCPVIAGIMVGMFFLRGRLLAADGGFSPLFSLVGLACLAVSVRLKLALRRELPLRVLIGMPEISRDAAGHLITAGLYARIRHPRYVQMDFALAGSALIANFPAVYLFLFGWFVGIYLVVLMEERELAGRFGEAYREYCRRVPRFIPRCRRRSRAR